MMVDIFSSFDPFTLSSFSSFPNTSWLFIFTLPIIIESYWALGSFITMMVSPLMNTMNEQLTRSSMDNMKSSALFIIPLFIMMLMFNLLGLTPYCLSLTNHLMFTLTFGLPLWMSLVISSFVYNFYQGTAMLLPPGAPTTLNPFLVIVETVSTLVRPITLSFRLAANMTAGHVVLGLMGSYMSSIIMSSFSQSLLFLSLMSGYIMFEFAICAIQAYVFCLLLTLYANDHSTL
uniref:ATP synthase subunit a n=1 Tax=Myrianida brachycephala TaxID=884646 RepID=A0A1C9UZD5_MYRBC|nr:ATP synthase F0 subunit 6 [Myrianida brachycephala]AOR87132.1 ATP synthase F0 subunit 6 [Myrianida brachycephala]